ncbi:MAG: AAA family ATPase [Bacteroidales bacterium]|nr:AAA family ATPase [Bacteroidales bacterium]
MKFIYRLKQLSRRKDLQGLRNLLEQLGNDPETFTTPFQGIGSCADWQPLFFCYSDNEAALVLIDTRGAEDELADEEEFGDERPLWFTSNAHRVSPFAQLSTLRRGFRESISDLSHKIDDTLIVVISNTHIINDCDMEETFEDDNGVVFHRANDLDNWVLPNNANNRDGKKIFDQFARSHKLYDKLYTLYHPYKSYLEPPTLFNLPGPQHDPGVDHAPCPGPCNVTEQIPADSLNEFFALEDPDFRKTTEAVSPSGERFTLKQDDMPPVEILAPLVDPHEFLNQMVGLEQLKSSMADIVAYARYSKRVKEAFPGMNAPGVNLHTIITGNPGTGKTTMCRIYGGLLHKAGILSRGHTVVASRSTFVGEHFGTEEQRMRQCLKLAQGGCLFIDEAGLLFNGPHPHDPGKGVIQLMLQVLAEESNRDIAVVLALYANDKSLERLYQLNPGIRSRFINVLSFPDYSWDELLEITHRKAKAQGLSFTPNAWHGFCRLLRDIYDRRDRDFGNAREVVNLLQRCLIRHAVRCEKQQLTGHDLLRITVRDIPQPLPTLTTPRIGFK